MKYELKSIKLNPCDGANDDLACGQNSKCLQTWGGDELCIDSADKVACEDRGIEFFECATGCHFCEDLICEFETVYVECDILEQLSVDDLVNGLLDDMFDMEGVSVVRPKIIWTTIICQHLENDFF